MLTFFQFQFRMVDNSLKVVGAGQLGLRVALLWKRKFPESNIFLKTRSHDEARTHSWSKAGFKPLSKETESRDSPVKAKNVLFCAPLTNNPSYVDDVRESLYSWSKEDGGVFVFTSSSGVYEEKDGGIVDEKSPVKQNSDRYKILLQCEDVVKAAGGIVMRLAGLYTKRFGPHSYWLKNSSGIIESPSCPNGLINLIHYDDAASVIVDALTIVPGEPNKVFLVSDGVPTSRQDICQAAMKCPEYSKSIFPKFTGNPTKVEGKRCNTTRVREAFGWRPKFQSFADFMTSGYNEEMDLEGLL